MTPRIPGKELALETERGKAAIQAVQDPSWASPAAAILLNKHLTLGKRCLSLQEKKTNVHFSVTNAMESPFPKLKIKTSKQNPEEIKRNPSDS